MGRLVRVVPLLLAPAAMGAAPPSEPPAGPTFTLLSWNVNYGLSGDPDALALLARVDADVVLLQESDDGWEDAIRDSLAGRYPFMDFVQHDLAGGLAVLSRYDFRDVGVSDSPVGWFPAWIVRVDVPGGPVQIVQVHLKPPVAQVGGFATGWITAPAQHRREVEAAWDTRDPSLPTIVAGDFNEDGGPALRFLARNGLRCALHDAHPDALTWRWDFGWFTMRDALDHVFHDARVAPVDVGVLDAGASDHLPIVGRFSVSRAASIPHAELSVAPTE